MTNSTRGFPTLKSPPCELSGSIERVAHLTGAQRDAMFALMDQYYETTRPIFDADLAEKERVILLKDPTSGLIKGFSTMMRLDLAGVTALFSGDTIIHADYRYTTALPQYWAELAFSMRDQIKRVEPERPVFWFLITSGYKTYRYLPTFFRDFYPRYDRSTPAEIQQLMHTLARTRYGAQYDEQAGVIRLQQGTPLRQGVAEIRAHRLKNPHIAFFARANPGHTAGDELVCLAAIERENLTRAGRRMVAERG